MLTNAKDFDKLRFPPGFENYWEEEEKSISDESYFINTLTPEQRSEQFQALFNHKPDPYPMPKGWKPPHRK